MVSDAAWNELLDEFRALGGIAENIRLGQGPFGRGLFPIDPAKPINIRIPDTLLVSENDVSVENNVFRVKPDTPIGTRERAFLERYEEDFSWGPGHQETENFLEGMRELPDPLKEVLTKTFGLGRFFAPVSPEVVKNIFFGA